MGMSRRTLSLIAGSFITLFLISNPARADAQTDFTSRVQLDKSLLFYDLRTFTSYLDISLTNGSQDKAYMPIRAVVQSISNPNVTVANADGRTEDGRPYFDYSVLAGSDRILSPGETSGKKRWIFSNPGGYRFTYTVAVYAEPSDDMQPPTIEVLNPVDGSVVSMGSPYVTVVFRDDKSGVDLSSLAIEIDGTDETDNFGVTSNCALYRIPAKLEEGDHRIAVSLSDMRGNANVVTSRFRVRESTEIDRYIFSLPGSPWIFSSPGDGTYREYLSPEELGISEDRDVISLSVPSHDGGVYFSTPDREGIHHSIGSGAFNPFFSNAQLGLNVSDRISALDMGPVGVPVLLSVLGQGGIQQTLGLGSIGVFLTNDQLGLSPDAAINAVQRTSGEALYFHVTGQAGVYEHAGESNTLILTEDDLGVPGSLIDAFALLPERNSPSLAVVSPGADAVIRTGSPSMIAAFSDAESGIDASSFRAELDGADVTGSFTVSDTGASWQVPQGSPLPDGSHVLIISISDRAGNRARAISYFTVSTSYPPTVSISAEPTSITPGESAILSWASSHADALSIDCGIGAVDPSGSVAVSPAQTTTYTVSATGPGGSATGSVTVIVRQPPDVTISAGTLVISAGESAVLSWTATGADSVTIDNGIGPVDPSGTISVAPESTTTYTITASGPGGTTVQKVTIEVTPKPARQSARAYITNYEGNRVSVVDLDTNAVTGSIEVGYGPYGIAVSPDGSTVYVAAEGGGISVIDANTDTVKATIDMSATTIGLSPDGSILYATDCNEGTLTAIDTASLTPIRIAAVCPMPHGIAVSSDGERIYMSSLEDGTVSIVDSSTFDIIETVAVAHSGDAVWDIEASPDGSRVYALSASSCKLSVIDGLTGSVIGSLSLLPERKVSKCYLAVSPDGSRIAVSYIPRSGSSQKVLIIDGSTLEILASIPVQEPSDPAFSPDGLHVYVPGASLNGIHVISTLTNSITGSITGDFSYPHTCGRFIAERRERISGRVTTGATGRGGIVVTLSDGSWTRSFLTDAQGGYFFYASPGRYTLSFSGSGYVFSQQNVDVNVTESGISLADTEILFGARIWTEPASIIAGQSAELRWECVNAAGVSIDQGVGEVEATGSLQIAPTETTTYLLTAVRSDGSTLTGQATLTVVHGPTVSITAEPQTIVQGQTAILSWTSTDAETLSMDQSIGEIELSGSLAVSPSETTTYTITATGPAGTNTTSFTLIVTPPLVTITSPHDGESIFRPDTMVTGTIRDALSPDPAVLVNGVPAMVYGDTFVANHVPLEEGSNNITATARDGQGHSAQASITVYAATAGPYFSLVSSSESGFSPLETNMRIDTPLSLKTFLLDTAGPGSVEYLDGSSSSEYTARMTAPGIYYLTARLTDGSHLRDTMGIVVFDQEDADARIREKWNGMKTRLINGDAEGALGFFTLPSIVEYREIFTLLSRELPVITAGMEDIEKVYIDDAVAKYRIRKNEVINGVQYRITHYIYFARDAYGNWYIDSF